MPFPPRETVDELRRTWTDRFVRLRPNPPEEWVRFANRTGRVVTVNFAGRAIVDFADGGWYDLPHFADLLEPITDPAAIAAFDASANSAQARPVRQS